MKKIITTIAAILIIVFTAGAFVACKDKDKTTDKTIEEGFDAVVSDKITAEEWAALAEKPIEDTENFRIKALEKYTNKTDENGIELSEPLIQGGIGTVEFKSGVMYMNTDYIGEMEGMQVGFLCCPDKWGKWRFFAKSPYPDANGVYVNGEWEEWNDEASDEGYDFYRYMGEGICSEYNYNDVKYSEEHKGYIYEDYDEEEGVSTLIVIKFKDGKLVGEKQVMSNKYMEKLLIYEYCDCGKVADITIPEEVKEFLAVPWQPYQ